MIQQRYLGWLLLGIVIGIFIGLYLTRHTTPDDRDTMRAEWRRPMATRKAG